MFYLVTYIKQDVIFQSYHFHSNNSFDFSPTAMFQYGDSWLAIFHVSSYLKCYYICFCYFGYMTFKSMENMKSFSLKRTVCLKSDSSYKCVSTMKLFEQTFP